MMNTLILLSQFPWHHFHTLKTLMQMRWSFMSYDYHADNWSWKITFYMSSKIIACIHLSMIHLSLYIYIFPLPITNQLRSSWSACWTSKVGPPRVEDGITKIHMWLWIKLTASLDSSTLLSSCHETGYKVLKTPYDMTYSFI